MDTQKSCCNYPKIGTVSFYYRVIGPKDADGIANSADPDQTAPQGGEILSEPKWRFIAQSLSCSPFHRLKMTEILLKGCKTLTHPSTHPLL